MDLDVVVTHGPGLDVHKKVIVTTVLIAAVSDTSGRWERSRPIC
jgi:hypothetical protein